MRRSPIINWDGPTWKDHAVFWLDKKSLQFLRPDGRPVKHGDCCVSHGGTVRQAALDHEGDPVGWGQLSDSSARKVACAISESDPEMAETIIEANRGEPSNYTYTWQSDGGSS